MLPNFLAERPPLKASAEATYAFLQPDLRLPPELTSGSGRVVAQVAAGAADDIARKARRGLRASPAGPPFEDACARQQQRGRQVDARDPVSVARELRGGADVVDLLVDHVVDLACGVRGQRSQKQRVNGIADVRVGEQIAFAADRQPEPPEFYQSPTQ